LVFCSVRRRKASRPKPNSPTPHRSENLDDMALCYRIPSGNLEDGTSRRPRDYLLANQRPAKLTVVQVATTTATQRSTSASQKKACGVRNPPQPPTKPVLVKIKPGNSLTLRRMRSVLDKSKTGKPSENWWDAPRRKNGKLVKNAPRRKKKKSTKAQAHTCLYLLR